MLILNKTLEPADYEREDFQEVLSRVDCYMAEGAPQHPHRRWEYAVALIAIEDWIARHPGPTVGRRYLDVGGSGSPFWRMLPSQQVIVVDPLEGQDLAGYLQTDGRMADVVTCLSVLEHVEDLEGFLYHLGCVVKPSGLLVLTMDCCGCAGVHYVLNPDAHHFCWMRKRTFTPLARQRLIATYTEYGELSSFTLVGAFDPIYHGPHIYDYSFCALVMEKRR